MAKERTRAHFRECTDNKDSSVSIVNIDKEDNTVYAKVNGCNITIVWVVSRIFRTLVRSLCCK